MEYTLQQLEQYNDNKYNGFIAYLKNNKIEKFTETDFVNYLESELQWDCHIDTLLEYALHNSENLGEWTERQLYKMLYDFLIDNELNDFRAQEIWRNK